jgi:eukaryotic-like serine/threonine-protein kinase
MECPQCGLSNPAGVSVCTTCATPLPWDDRTLTISPGSRAGSAGGTDSEQTLASNAPSGLSARSAWSSPVETVAFTAAIEPGRLLGNRYEILQILGEGGMGAVYKATDRELDRLVAIKVIRPELARYPDVLQRFKQELILARQITHRNVIRIFDLGEAEGIKFITMEYIDGRDLKSLVRQKGKFEPKEAVEVIVQVCRALEAAHAEGVIHRDLKPQNIMLDAQGKVSVMDFGIARSMDMGGGMTQTGALVGTIEYMSPEQAKGESLDGRSDLFSLGIIFYEILTGDSPFAADTAMASLYKRIKENARPPIELRPDIPRVLNDIVLRCLETDREKRYASATEILQDLEVWQGTRSGTVVAPARTRFPIEKLSRDWKWVASGVAVLLLAIVGVLFRGKFSSMGASQTGPSAPEVSLAILPFHNASGDPSLDWLGPSLADMLSTDVGESAHMRTVSPDRVHQVLADLQISGNASIDPTMIGRVAEFSNADTVVSGEYAKFGDQIRIDGTVQDLKHDRTVPIKIEAVDEKDIPGAVDRLAESIRQKLALPENVLKELKASSFQPNSSSVEALRDYNQGVGFQRDGKNLEAQKQFEAATKADPNFALAFSRLAQTYSGLGYDDEAEQSAQEAVTLSQNLPEAEKYLISAIRSEVIKNYPEAIKAYENLAKVLPDNSDVESALATLYKDSGNLAKAREYYQKLLSANPKDISATIDLGRLALKSGDPQGSLEPLNRAYSLSIQVDNPEQQAASLHFMAVAYGMLGKPEEDLRSEQQALAIWRRIGQKRGLALSLNEMASAQSTLGQPKDALASYQEALNLRREIGDKRGLGDSLIDLGSFNDERGDHDEALKMYKEALQLERDLGNEGLQAICLNNIGTAYANKGQFEDALTYYQQALELREKSKVPEDIVEAVHNLGETSAAMGQYGQAISYYLRALDLRRSMDDRRGAAIESYSLGTLFDYQGRFGAAVNSMQEALKTFHDIKDNTSWMAKVLDGYGEALILAGRGEEAKSYLDEALGLSRQLKNDNMVAEALGFQGDAFFYRGDFKSAQALYEQALQAATRSKEPDTVLIAKANLAKVQVQEKGAQETVSALRQMIQQADDIGLKYTSVECSIFVAEAMMQNRDYPHSRKELESAVLLSDKFGMQPLSARLYYLLAKTAQVSGNNGDARDNYREALALLEAMRKDPGAEKLLQRADFKVIYDESTRRTQAAKS